MILTERHMRHAHVVTLLQEEKRAASSGVGDSISIRRTHDQAASEDLDLMGALQEF